MRAINHAMTGAIIGLVVGEPLVAVPAAVVSHFVMDAIPHHGVEKDQRLNLLRSSMFRRLLYADAVLCGALVLLLAVRRPENWLLAAIYAFAAAAPDLLSINLYQKTLARKPWKPGPYVAFASKIQWFERPIGAVVEVAWFAACLILLIPFLR